MNADKDKVKQRLRELIVLLAADIFGRRPNYRSSLLGIIQHATELAKLEGFL